MEVSAVGIEVDWYSRRGLSDLVLAPPSALRTWDNLSACTPEEAGIIFMLERFCRCERRQYDDDENQNSGYNRVLGFRICI